MNPSRVIPTENCHIIILIDLAPLQYQRDPNPLENLVHNLELGYHFDKEMLYATEDNLSWIEWLAYHFDSSF
jgi:hypothetical protein